MTIEYTISSRKIEFSFAPESFDRPNIVFRNLEDLEMAFKTFEQAFHEWRRYIAPKDEIQISEMKMDENIKTVLFDKYIRTSKDMELYSLNDYLRFSGIGVRRINELREVGEKYGVNFCRKDHSGAERSAITTELYEKYCNNFNPK